MKNYPGTIILALLFVLGSRAQTSCSTYYPFDEGTSFQITMYDNKDKTTGIIDYVVKESTGNSAILAYEMLDDKGTLIVTSEYGISCEDDGISIDFNSLAAPGIMEQYKDMEIDITGTNLSVPNNLSPGQTLPDADMLMNIRMAPINMKMTITIYNRKVGARETLTTPAGTFDCIVISDQTDTKMGMKFSGSSKQWLAEGVGMVKQESYNKKGKLMGSSVLTAFNK